MIQFLSPGFAWALAALALILVLYLLRRKYLPQRVPSVFLWRRSTKDHAANRPFQRLMKNLLLPLQLLAALLLALALMRPVLPGGTAGRTILVFDVSGSMQTQSAGKSRLDTAKEEALRLIRSLPAEEKITVLTAGEETGRPAVSADREEAEKAISAIVCGRGGADMGKALALAEALAREGEEGSAEATVFSDTFRAADAGVHGDALVLRIVNVGEKEENCSVYSLTAEGTRAYARAANFGESRTVTLVCEADGVLCDAKEIEIPEGETAGVSFDIPENTKTVRVALREKDALPADNAAEAAVRHARSRQAAVTSDSVFLESALRVRPDLTVLRTEAGALSSTEADLYILGENPLIFTRRLPEEGYDAESTSFGPFSWPAEAESVPDSAATEAVESPLTGGVTLKNVFFRSMKPVSGGKAAVTAGGKTLVAYTEDAAVFGFNVHDTNLPLKYDYPVLIQNLLDWLLPEETEEAEAGPGPMPIAESDTRIIAPDYEAAAQRTAAEQGRDLAGILIAAFLILMLLEMGVARYVG